MPEATNEYITEDGMLVEEFPSGVKTKKCITEECIREHHGEERCSCGECVTKRVVKEDDGLSESYSMDELREVLPDRLWTEVAEHLSDPAESEEEVEEDVSKGFVIDDLTPRSMEKDAPEDVEKHFTPYDHVPGPGDDVTDDSIALEMFYGDQR